MAIGFHDFILEVIPVMDWRSSSRRSAIIAACCLASAAVKAADGWSDSFTGRLGALALLQTLNGEILASSSATRTLEQWCAAHHLSGTAPARIIAQRVATEGKAASPDQLQRLQLSADEPVKYRHVRLLCGDAVLSEADNWYVPGRLTAAMNDLLDHGDTPFGKVVHALSPFRRTFFATLLWHPLADGWEMQPGQQDGSEERTAMPDVLFEHRAVLYSKDNLPFAEVDERYQRGLLGFPPPQQR